MVQILWCILRPELLELTFVGPLTHEEEYLPVAAACVTGTGRLEELAFSDELGASGVATCTLVLSNR